MMQFLTADSVISRKRIRLWFVWSASVLLLAGCHFRHSSKTGSTTQIGAVLPLTGKSAQYGTWIREGLELGRDQINQNGGINGKPLEIVYEDDQADPKLAVSAMQELTGRYHVSVVFGSWASSCALAEAPFAEKTHTVEMAEAISPKIRDAGDYIFRIQPDARYYIDKLVPFVTGTMKAKSVSILYVNNDFGADQATVFTQDFSKLGGHVLSSDGFKPGETDFRTLLTKVKALGPDAVFIPAYTESGNILKQARELGMKQKFIASVPFENPDILKIAGPAAEGVIYPHHFDPNSSDPVIQAYQQKYRQKYGHASEGFAALAYDGIMALAKAMQGCNDGPCTKDALYRIHNLPAVCGPTTFDDRGDVVKPILIKMVRNGQFCIYK